MVDPGKLRIKVNAALWAGEMSFHNGEIFSYPKRSINE